MNVQHSIDQNQADLERLIKKFRAFISKLKKDKSISQLAQFILYTRSFNSFKAAILLADEGLPIECLNSLRLALETGWLALVLKNDEHSALEWLAMVRYHDMPEYPRKKYRKTYGNLTWIKSTVSSDEIDKKQRENIYKILSVRSHANVATSFFVRGLPDGSSDYCLYEPGGIQDHDHRYRCLKSILFCLKYLLHDMERAKEGRFDCQWKYDHVELMHMSNVIWQDKNGQYVVDAEAINSAAQVTFLIAMSSILPKEAFEKLKQATEKT